MTTGNNPSSGVDSTPRNSSRSQRVSARSGTSHWSELVAERVREVFPDASTYVCAAGISPSGIVHFGNFRDVMTSLMVMLALRNHGCASKLIFSWDNYDRFRKVPAGLDPSYAQYIGRALCDVPDPEGKFPSYARRFEVEFEQAMEELEIPLEYRSQSEAYRRGDYDQQILSALRARERLAALLLSFMSDKGKELKGIDEAEFTSTYYPISVYSRFTGKDSTKVLSFDGKSVVRYRCAETGKEDEVDLLEERIAKLAWKIDWPMRWAKEGVVFEPGGHDHASPGGSYDVASEVVRALFDREPPVFVEYKFVGLRGLDGKMSGSKGNAVAPSRLLEIYEPSLLKWLYTRKDPDQEFQLAFDTEIFRQYDEFDREITEYWNQTLAPGRQSSVRLSGAGVRAPHSPPISFRQAVGLGQIVQWEESKVRDLSQRLGLGFSDESIHTRLPKASAWLETYNPSARISLLEAPHVAYREKLSEEGARFVATLCTALTEHRDASIEQLEAIVYGIPKDPTLDQKQNSVRQRAFFKDVYNLLIGADTGPRLSTFLWAVDRDRVIELLR